MNAVDWWQSILAGGLAGAGVSALASVYVTTRTLTTQRELAKTQNENDRQMASDARFFEHRRDTYLDAVQLLTEMMQDGVWNIPGTADEARQLDERYGFRPPPELNARVTVFAPQVAELFSVAYRRVWEAIGHAVAIAGLHARDSLPPGYSDNLDVFNRKSADALQAYSSFVEAMQRDFR